MSTLPKLPSVSVVIVVKNERSIAKTLELLLPQAAEAGAELIVVDASDRVSLADIAQAHPSVRWLAYANPNGKTFTIPEQRNMGVAASKAPVIVFIDAGGEPGSTWLARLIAPILAGTERLCAGAICPTNPRLFNAFTHRASAATHLEVAPTGNLAVHRSVFAQVGGFDEKLTYGEDVDFTWRARDSGVPIRFVPAAVVAYDFGAWRRRVRRTVRYGAARIPLYQKHKLRRKQLLRAEPATVAYPLFLLGLPLTVVWPYYPLLLVPLFLKNIRRDPFRTLGNNLLFGLGVLRGLAVAFSSKYR